MMQNRSYILIALCFLLLLGGCKKKKQHRQSAQPAATEQQSPAPSAPQGVPVTPVQPATPVPTVVEEETIVVVEPVIEEEPARPTVQTINVQRMTVTVNDRGHRFSTPAALRWQRGTGAVLSVQPLMGIEALRGEVTPQKVTIINKLTRSYAQADAAQIKAHYAIDLAVMLDATIDNEVLNHMDDPIIRLTQTQGQTTIEITINPANIRINENVNIQPANIQGYKKVSAEQLLHTLL